MEFYFNNFNLQTNVSTCVHGSPHFGQVNVFFLSPPLPEVVPPAIVFAPASVGGVGSEGAFDKLLPVVNGRAATTLTILWTIKKKTIVLTIQ